MYTKDDLDQAKAELERVQKAWENYSGNNPDKYRAQIRDAGTRVRTIERHLKEAGVIPMTDAELLERELDATFPDAQSKQVVEHKGKRYQRNFNPLGKSLTGKTVTEWGKEWKELPPE